MGDGIHGATISKYTSELYYKSSKRILSLAFPNFQNPIHVRPPPPLGASGKTAEGIQELEKALSCKYVAGDATKALNKIFQVTS